MSPPIYTPDGSEVSEIVLPDGSTASEVIGPDGNVVFEAGPDIPDSGDLHARYDFSEYSSGTTGFSDLTGNGYDLVNGSITGLSATINGVQAAEFDGSTDGLYSNTFSDVASPTTVFAVVEAQTASFGGRFGRVYNLNSSSNRLLGVDSQGTDEWQVNGGGNLSGSTDMSVQLLTVVFDSTTLLRENGIQTNSGSFTDVAMNEVQVGFNRALSGEYWGGKIGEVLIYPDKRTSSQISDVESYLADKWGITI